MIIAVIGAALLPVIPVAARQPTPSISSAASNYTALTPVRVFDTRNGTGTTVGPLGGPGSRDLVIAGANGVPAGATGVVLNVTVVNTTAPSFLTIYPTGTPRQLTSNLNWVAGQVVPNLVESPLGGGSVTIYNSAGATDVVADLEGYFSAPSGSAGGEVALTPARITDTRTGSGYPNAGGTLAAGGSLDIQVTGAGGVPLIGVSGAILNVTVTNTTAPSFLTVWPQGSTRNLVSNLNWTAGLTVPNRVFVPVGPTGKISVYSPSGSVDVIVDVGGYFTDATAAGKSFTPQSPIRLADTRGGGTLSAGGTLTLQIGGVAGVPSNASAVILNVTVTNTTAASFLTVYPSTATRPFVSDLNWTAGVTVPNLTVATLGSTGAVSFYSPSGNVDVVVDLFGYFAPNPTVNNMSVSANPANVAVSATSVVTATVTNGGTAVVGDTVTFSVGSPSVAGSCGTLSSTTGITNASGQATTTYTASATPGTCVATAIESAQSATGNTTISQHAVTATLTVTSNKATVPADGTSTAAITATAKDAGTVPVSGETITFTTSGTACGTLSATSGVTGSQGQVMTTYTASTAVGSCTITGTTSNGITASVTITQTALPLVLTPATQTLARQNASFVPNTATITATAKNADGTPNAGVMVLVTVPSGPNAGYTTSCVTSLTGVCTFTVPSPLTVGTDTVQGCLDVNANGICDSTDPTATATIIWTAGPPAQAPMVEPGYRGELDVESADIPPTRGIADISGGGFTSTCPVDPATCAGKAGVSAVEGQNFTAYARVIDDANNPTPGISVTFRIFHASSSNYFGSAGKTCDLSSAVRTIAGCTLVAKTAITDSTGLATVTWTQTEDGVDYWFAYDTGTPANESYGAEVIWGKSSLTITPDYTTADMQKNVGDTVTYTGTSIEAGVPNTNCVNIQFYTDNWSETPNAQIVPFDGDRNDAWFSAVGAGETAYSDQACTTPVTLATGPGSSLPNDEIFMKPSATNGTFHFTIKDATQGALVAPVAWTTTTDFVGVACTNQPLEGDPGSPKDKFDCGGYDPPGLIYNGATGIGATAKFGTAASGVSVTVTPTTGAPVAAGGTRTYTETVLVNGAPNTNATRPNAFSFNQFVTGGTTPGDIAYVELTVDGVTYCVQGNNNNPPATACPAADTTVLPAGITVNYSTYGGAGNAFSEVKVVGIGTFNVTISDAQQPATTGCASAPPASCLGPATPIGWIELNGNTTRQSSEPMGLGGTTTFAIPTGGSASLVVAPPGSASWGCTGAPDKFNDGQWYGALSANPGATSCPGIYDIAAQVLDQSGNPYTGTTSYAVTWTLHNNGTAAKKVYVLYVENSDTNHCSPNFFAATLGLACGSGHGNLGVTAHFPHAGATPANNGTLAALSGTAGDLTIAGGATLSFTTYTRNTGYCSTFLIPAVGGLSGSQCSLVALNSGDDTSLTVTAQLAQDSTTATAGALLGSSSSATLNWVNLPAAAGTVSGTVVAWDNPLDAATADPDVSMDWVVVQTALGRYLVNFSQGGSDVYSVSGTTATEDQFEAALAVGKTYAVTLYGNAGQTNSLT